MFAAPSASAEALGATGVSEIVAFIDAGHSAGMLTQGGQGGRPAPLASQLQRTTTHFLLNLHGI